MKLYSVTHGFKTENFLCSKINVLDTGQIVLYGNDGIIAVFNKDATIISIEADRVSMNEHIEKETQMFFAELKNTDEWFLTDIFLEKNTPEEAHKKTRMIIGKTIAFLEKFKNHRV